MSPLARGRRYIVADPLQAVQLVISDNLEHKTLKQQRTVKLFKHAQK